MNKKTDLQSIPGVGPSIEQDFFDLGIYCVSDLKNKNPEALYCQLCAMQGKRIDRCVLYVFRCAVYFASTHQHDPEKLKWWQWKD
jgi:nucleotidyltransferase/DNA polymerase involved in DNA repair